MPKLWDDVVVGVEIRPAAHRPNTTIFEASAMTKRHSQSRIRRRIARGWLSQGRKNVLLGSIVESLRKFGPMNADQLQIRMDSQGESWAVPEIDSALNAEDARDWRTRRLRRATGYPPGYYISFDNNAGRD